MTITAIQMNGIAKEFGPVKALDDANLTVHSGSIHGVVGQNGAGKSTIIKVLAGIYTPTAGDIFVNGELLTSITPESIEKKGIHFIHQDRLLVPTATVAEAIFLKNEPTIGPFINLRKMKRQARDLLNQYFNIDLPPNKLIRDLSTAEQKIVQITRALANNARVLVLDEPTAALVQQEVERLFMVLRRLRDEGIAVIFISHYMQEIKDICDTVTVLRNGSDVGVLQTKDSSINEIVSLMTNRDNADMYPSRQVALGEPVLELKNLTLNGVYNNVSFDVKAGEIVGLTGLLGSGDKQILQTIFGLIKPDAGTILIDGIEQNYKAPGDAVDNGVAMVPEDRRAHGVAMGLSVAQNISIASLDKFSAKGFVSRQKEAEKVDELIQNLGIMTPDRQTRLRNLSGGNQQKVAVGKWLSCDSRVYLLDDPTVAVDVGAKVEIYNLMNRLATSHAAQVFISSDLEELTELCDRVLVIYRGNITHEFKRGDIDGDGLLSAASGAHEAPQHA